MILYTEQYIPMLTFEQMAIRLLVAIALGAIIGLEREVIGKDAGIRTTMLVSSGSAIFTMIALTLPYIISASVPNSLEDILAHNSGFLGMAANIVTGIGFLGAGIIIKDKEGAHVRGLTTAAAVWAAAAVGTLVGVGLTSFAAFAAILITSLLYVLRKMNLYQYVRPGHRPNHENGD